MDVQLALPGGTPPLIVPYTRLSPTKSRAGFVGSIKNGAAQAAGSEQAGSVGSYAHGDAGSNESYG